MKAVGLFFLLILVIGCLKETDEELINNGPVPYTGLYVYYSIGSGWTNWSYKLTIDSTNAFTVNEKREYPEKSERNNVNTITSSEMDSLYLDLSKLTKVKIDRYGFGDDKPTDLPVTHIIYRIAGFSDTASIYCPNEGEIPVELNRLLARINKLKAKYDITQ